MQLHVVMSPLRIGTYVLQQPGIVFLEFQPGIVIKSAYPVGEASMLVIMDLSWLYISSS